MVSFRNFNYGFRCKMVLSLLSGRNKLWNNHAVVYWTTETYILQNFLPPISFLVSFKNVEIEQKTPTHFMAELVDIYPILATHVKLSPVFE